MTTKPKAGPVRQRKAPATKAPEPPNLPQTKTAMLVALLSAPGGATINQLSIATGWQVHSVRGALAGVIKKKLGLKVISQITEGGRIYHIEPAK
jgi:hypothetical protein